ncbi:protein DMP2-like [Impatiens glandulifera]|uniref:protein DMP2-like n=1 Tax=Impatiens glandulifera TaxID=253017 RepID=UPI001FB0909A|nr:protein DMP2-like [Impatiens glandulifera]
MAGIGSLLKLLPTGTVFTFEFLNPVLSNNGTCSTSSPVYKYLTSILIAICGLSCFFSSFTDSYKTKDGKIRYVFATFKGFWPSADQDSEVDSSKYKIKIGDFVHALLAVSIFAVLALLDSNTVACFYPSFQSNGKKLMMALPPVIGALSGFIFAVFPNNRHGIGYPAAANSSSSVTNVINKT